MSVTENSSFSRKQIIIPNLYSNPRTTRFPIKWKLKKESFVSENKNCGSRGPTSKTYVLIQDENCSITLSLRYENKIYTVGLEAAENLGAELLYAFCVSSDNLFCLTKMQYQKFQFPPKRLTRQFVDNIFESSNKEQLLVINCLVILQLNTDSIGGLCGLKEVTDSFIREVYPKASPVKNQSQFSIQEEKLIEKFMLLGDIPNLNTKIAIKLAYHSHSKNIHELVAICTQHILCHMTNEDAIEVFKLALFLENEELQRKCADLESSDRSINPSLGYLEILEDEDIHIQCKSY